MPARGEVWLVGLKRGQTGGWNWSCVHRVVSLAGFSLACIQWCSIGFRLLEAPTIEKILAVNVNKNVLPPVAPIHHVVNGARILDSHRARHERKVTNRPATSSAMNNLTGWTNLRFDPFPVLFMHSSIKTPGGFASAGFVLSLKVDTSHS